jgi:hypothetical protein
MNTVRFFTTALVGIVTTCVLSAGAASAQPVPYVPRVAAANSPSLIAAEPAAGFAAAKDRAQLLLKQKSYIEHVQRAYAEEEAAGARSRAAQKHPRVSHSGSLVDPNTSTVTNGSTPNAPSQRSGDGSEVPVLAVTALAGLALGAAGSSASRRLRRRPRMAA